jgi:hypothetical protein
MVYGKKILLLGVYGMEMVECGGVLCKNARNGGISHASIMFASEGMQKEINDAAEKLDTTVEYLNFDSITISSVSWEAKSALIRVIRNTKPDIIITQDPEHCVEDLDPGRRPAMELLLESMALAGRDYDMPGLEDTVPHRDYSVYYMTPQHPNCLVDISDVWDEKCEAMDMLKKQLEFIGELSRGHGKNDLYEKVFPSIRDKNDLERGTIMKKVMDQAYHLYHGATGHNNVLFSENYRKQGMFVLDQLI